MSDNNCRAGYLTRRTNDASRWPCSRATNAAGPADRAYMWSLLGWVDAVDTSPTEQCTCETTDREL